MEKRPFGKSGESFPILSFGGEYFVDEHGCNEEQAMRLINTAIDRGIRYFDTAYVYANGQSEERLGLVAKHRRKEMWLATKVMETSRDGALRQLETSLKRLQTDYLDEWRLHSVWDYERLEAFTAKGGALEAAIEAKQQGIVGHISISCHSDPQVLLEAFRRFPFESALVAVSPLDHFILSFVEEFLPYAAANDIPVIGMKVLAMGVLKHDVERALRYAFSLPLCTVVVGMGNLAQLEQNLAIAEAFTPLSDAERLAFFQDILPLVRLENMPWKALDWDNPIQWTPRRRGLKE